MSISSILLEKIEELQLGEVNIMEVCGTHTKHIPVVIFSSLVNDEMRVKGEQLGADAQLSKPEIGNLVRLIDGLVAKMELP